MILLQQNNDEYYDFEIQFKDSVRATVNRLKTLKNDYGLVSDIRIKGYIAQQIEIVRGDLLNLTAPMQEENE